MNVLLVEPVYDHPFPHLFTLKAITYWRSQGESVRWTKGNAVEITTGCSVGCGFCLVPKLYGVRSRRVDRWQTHFADREIWHVIDDNLSQSMLSIPSLADDLLEFFGAAGPSHGHPIDLNSGIEPRSFTDEVADVLTQLPVHPWRTALDETSEAPYTLRAIEMMKQRGVDPKELHVYLLYGWKDDLADALHRLDLLLDADVTPFAMRFVPLDWFGGKLEYRPPHWYPLHYIDFARYVNQMKRRSLKSARRWSFRWFLENCTSHDHRDDPYLKGET